MKRALQMGIAAVMVATWPVLGASPAGAVVCTIDDGTCTGSDTTGSGVNHAFARSGNTQVAETSFRLDQKTLPPNPVYPTDPYSPGFGVLTAGG